MLSFTISKTSLAVIVLLGVIASSCNFRTYQKVYVPSAPHVADFRTDNKKSIKVLASLLDVELQYAKATDINKGFTVNGLVGFNGHFYGEVGKVFFKNKGRKYVELNTGLGLAHVNSQVDGIPNDIFYLPGLAANGYYRHDIKATYLRAFIQPSYFIQSSPYERVGFTFKVSPILFLNYDYFYKENSYGGSNDRGVLEIDEVVFKNSLALNIEPVIHLKAAGKNHPGRSFYMQLGGSLSFANMRSTTSQTGSFVRPAFMKNFNHPKHNRVIFNVGYEFNF